MTIALMKNHSDPRKVMSTSFLPKNKKKKLGHCSFTFKTILNYHGISK